jgi:2Fe-2S ferredoxin
MDLSVPGSRPDAESGERVGTIKVTDADGAVHHLVALEGWRVMEIIRDHGLPIESECGGACACATCHVHVGAGWAERLHSPLAEEEDMLDGVDSLAATSRLSCQIIWRPELDGLEIVLPGKGGSR